MHIYVVNRKKSKEFYFFLYLFIYLFTICSLNTKNILSMRIQMNTKISDSFNVFLVEMYSFETNTTNLEIIL